MSPLKLRSLSSALKLLQRQADSQGVRKRVTAEPANRIRTGLEPAPIRATIIHANDRPTAIRTVAVSRMKNALSSTFSLSPSCRAGTFFFCDISRTSNAFFPCRVNFFGRVDPCWAAPKNRYGSGSEGIHPPDIPLLPGLSVP